MMRSTPGVQKCTQVSAQHGFNIGLTQPCEFYSNAGLCPVIGGRVRGKEKPRFIGGKTQARILHVQFGIGGTGALAFEASQKTVVRPGTYPSGPLALIFVEECQASLRAQEHPIV